MRLLLKKIILLPINLLDLIAHAYTSILSATFPGFFPFWLDAQIMRIADRKSEISHLTSGRYHKFIFHTPNALCQWRINTFSIKEPETLDWIDKYGGETTLFDIGANIGLYSVYYAKIKSGKVYAFEPSVFNLALLVKNINANNVQDKVRVITNPLTARNAYANFNLQVADEGGALSAFGVEHGQDGMPLKKVLSYETYGFSLDYLLDQGIIPEYPGMIKADVDGIEHLIMRGARKTLAHPKCRTVLIEVHQDFEELSNEVSAVLGDAGFERITLNGVNQIWLKPQTN